MSLPYQEYVQALRVLERQLEMMQGYENQGFPNLNEEEER